MRILEIEPDEKAGKETSDDDKDDHGDVQPDVDHLERDADDCPILRYLPTLPDHLVRHGAQAVLGRNPGEVVRPLVVEGHDLVLAGLELLQLRPSDPVAGVLVEGHRPGDAVELELAKLMEDQLGNVPVLVVVVLQALATGLQLRDRLVQGCMGKEKNR